MDAQTKSLLENASQGDSKAIGELLQDLWPELERFVSVKAGRLVKAKDSAADLVQSVCREVLERVQDQRFEFQGRAELRQWLYQAAVMKMQNRHRFHLAAKRDARREEWAGEAPSAAEQLFQYLSTPSVGAARREDWARFEQAFQQLPENFQQILVLIHVDGCNHREAALKMGIQEAYSRVLLSRALARLAKLGTN